VNGSAGNTITFTYTADTGGISNGTVTLACDSTQIKFAVLHYS